VSIRGIIPLTYSLDHCGPITRTVEDAAIMLNVLAGYDRLDIASVEHPAEDYVAGMRQPVNGLRIGIPRAPFFDLLDPDVAKAVEEALGALTKLTKNSKEVMLPTTRDICAERRGLRVSRKNITRMSRPLSNPTRRSLANAGTPRLPYVRE